MFDKLIIKCSHSKSSLKSRKRPRFALEEEESCCVCKPQCLKSMFPLMEIIFKSGHTSEQEKQALYLQSRLAVCASESEGFGHHVLEAAGFGCQVVTTKGQPMESILRWQVAPSSSKSRNLGLQHSLTSEEIYEAACELLQTKKYDQFVCQKNLAWRIDTFRSHFEHLLKIILFGFRPPLCCTKHFRCPILEVVSCPTCESRMHAALKHVNSQQPDRIAFTCEGCNFVNIVQISKL